MNQYKDAPKEDLAERAKELECLYLIDEILVEAEFPDVFKKISEIIPTGFRNMEACTSVVVLDDQYYYTKPPIDNGDEIESSIILNGEIQGYIKAMYPKGTFPVDETAFLPQEMKLLNTIASRVSESLGKKNFEAKCFKNDWEAIIRLLQNADHEMLLYVSAKMLDFLSKTNPKLLENIYKDANWAKYNKQGEINFPLETIPEIDTIYLSQVLFESARGYLTDCQIFDYISLWIYQGRTYELVKIVNKKDIDVKSIIRAINQYIKAVSGSIRPNALTNRWLTVELIRRFLTDTPELITNYQSHITVESFCELLDRYICFPKSIGKIGGKGTGYFIANQIIRTHNKDNLEFENFKTPKTWYISSDDLVNVIENNRLDELNEYKYQDILNIRASYPRIIRMFKNSELSPYIINQLDQILDKCRDKPLIIRSSSLLEDQKNSSFSGKYKSLFITNVGTKQERRRQLVEGILEVYASLYNPDSIQYRKERNLIDSAEQMGIMIQEVVGCKVGPYYFPLYAGVAFSNNELRWSPRIKRGEGLLRMVMGLGTRAVDRVGEDFPTLISPGQPDHRVNQTPLEMKKYSPQMIDAIDMENNQFVTLPISKLMKEYGDQIPNIDHVVSVLKNDFIADLNRFTADFESDDIIVTFNGLIKKTQVVKQIKSVLSLLQEKLGYPVDIEFASDGENFYLLQCRSQSRNYDDSPAAIPIDILHMNTVFTANKYICNGKVTRIKTVVYVDPVEYGNLEKYEDLIEVANVISELNRVLPRRSFILMGPGRWGSRGDIKLGVPVAYSDINNTSMLIEIAKHKSSPELSFGTHFFQDLAEENIKYLPLYPKEKGTMFNKSFFNNKNSLENILPRYKNFSHVVKVIQIEENYYGKELFILMNADLEKAIAYLDIPSNANISSDTHIEQEVKVSQKDYGWKWRHFMAEQIANKIDMDAYSVKGIYLFGSTNNYTAGLNSDIDLLIHFEGTQEQKNKLDTWLNGWSLALSEMIYLKTGYEPNGLLDVHYVTDQDIENKTSFAVKINSIYDPATPLRLNIE